MRKIVSILFLCGLFFLIGCFYDFNKNNDISNNTSAKIDIIEPIYYTMNVTKDIELATLEPKDGLLLGAYFPENEDYKIKDFEKKLSKTPNHYVYEYKLGTEFDTTFLIEAIARNRTPFISISCSEYNKYDIEEVEKVSDIIASFYVDAFIELYPSPDEESYNKEKYIDFFQKSSDIFKNKIENVAIIYTPSTENLYTSSDFLPNASCYDYIGFSYIGYILEDDSIIYNDFFAKFNYVYKKYAKDTPIFITKFMLSHFSNKNNTYYITENIEHTNTIFDSIIKNYDRVKGVNFFDINAIEKPLDNFLYNDDNYSYTDSNEILNNFNVCIKNDAFLSEFTTSIAKDTIKFVYDAVEVNDEMYVITDCLSSEFFKPENVYNKTYTFPFNDKTYYKLDDLIKNETEVTFEIDRINKTISSY